MRLSFDDLLVASEYLASAPAHRQASLARAMIGRARRAARYRVERGRYHPRWGNGSLMAAALSCRRRPRQGLDLAALACLIALVQENNFPVTQR